MKKSQTHHDNSAALELGGEVTGDEERDDLKRSTSTVCKDNEEGADEGQNRKTTTKKREKKKTHPKERR